MTSKYSLINVILVITLFVLSGCGGGGGDKTQPPVVDKPNTISGIVSAPGGALAFLQTHSYFARLLEFVIADVAADFSGVAPVANATVELIEIDSNGNQIGGVVETVMTNASGEFTINTALNVSTGLMIRVVSNTGAVMRAFVTGGTTNINPATEYVVAEILGAIQSQNDVSMSNFTTQEILDMLQVINEQNIDLTGADLNSALNAIETSAGATIDGLILAAIGVSGTLAVKVFLGDIPGVGTIAANNSDYQADVSIVQNGITQSGTTNTDGIVTFGEVSNDPVTITAQYDYIYPDAAVRGATTIHHLQPANGEVGIAIFTDYEGDDTVIDPVAGTAISGTISNIPSIPQGYQLILNVNPFGDACCGGGIQIPVPQGQTSVNYVVNNAVIVPNAHIGTGDYVLYAEISRWSLGTTFSRQYMVAAIYPAVVTLTGGNNHTGIDIDFNNPSSRVEFVEKSISMTNINIDEFNSQSRLNISTAMQFPDLGNVWFNSFTNNSLAGWQDYALPTVVSLASVVPVSASAGYVVDLEGDDKEWEIESPLSSGTSLSVSFLTPPVVTSPAPDETMTKSQAMQLMPTWQNPNTESVNYNLALIVNDEDISNSSGIEGIDFVFWVHFIKPDVTSIVLPSTAKAMFGDSGRYHYYHEFGQTVEAFNFESIFDFNVTQKLWVEETFSGFQAAGRTIPFNTFAP